MTLLTAYRDAYLKGLALSAGTLDPAFFPDTFAYVITVPYSLGSVTVDAAANNPLATVTVNGTTGTGAASYSVVLAPGENTAAIQVTALNRTTRQTYTLNILR